MWSPTADEIRVLRELALGNSTREVSTAMSCSEPTVKRLIQRVRRKLGARNRTHAVYLATKNGLI